MEENVCRICLQTSAEEEMTSIYTSDEQGTIISNKIKSCCGVKQPKESDGFPTNICSKCKVFLTIAYKLRTICQNSDAYLRRFKVKEDIDTDENEPIVLKTEQTEDFNNDVYPNDVEDGDDNISMKSSFSLPEQHVESNQMNNHIKPEKESQSEEDVIIIEKDEDDVNINSSKSNIYACDECDRTYSRKINLKKHKKIHKELKAGIREPPVKFGICPHCGDCFPRKNLPVHIKRHTGEKPYACDQCDMRYIRKQELIVHKRSHTGEKPHVCQTCGKGFSRATHLVRHIRVHTGERPYKCTQCDRGFAQRNDLNLHIRRHTGEKPYHCGICGERFINGTLLKNHRKATQHYEEERIDRFEKIRVTNLRRTYRGSVLINE